MQATQICSVPDCERAGQMRRGMCEMHYQRIQTRGGFELPAIPSLAERLAAGLVHKPNGCLEWIRSTYPKGYGQIKDNGKNVGTHRVAWTLANGPIPVGLEVCHHCDNPPCCETAPSDAYPDGHLFLGTFAENMADKMAKGRHHNQQKIHCSQGHFYDEANTHVRPNGWRDCKTCHRLREALFYIPTRDTNPTEKDTPP